MNLYSLFLVRVNLVYLRELKCKKGRGAHGDKIDPRPAYAEDFMLGRTATGSPRRRES